MVDVRALLVCAPGDWWSSRSNLRQAAALLSLHTSRMAARYGLAADARRNWLHRCFLFCSDYGQHPDIRRPEERFQFHPTALARIFDRVRVPVADPRHAGVSEPLRGTVRGAYDLFGRQLH